MYWICDKNDTFVSRYFQSHLYFYFVNSSSNFNTERIFDGACLFLIQRMYKHLHLWLHHSSKYNRKIKNLILMLNIVCLYFIKIISLKLIFDVFSATILRIMHFNQFNFLCHTKISCRVVAPNDHHNTSASICMLAFIIIYLPKIFVVCCFRNMLDWWKIEKGSRIPLKWQRLLYETNYNRWDVSFSLIY